MTHCAAQYVATSALNSFKLDQDLRLPI